MSNSSSAGDSLGIYIKKNPGIVSGLGVMGWFDIKHTCAKTGKVTDHSGPNALSQEGIEKMLFGFTGDATASGNTAATVATAIYMSITDSATWDAGDEVLSTNFTSVNTANNDTQAGTVDALYPDSTATNVSVVDPNTGTGNVVGFGCWRAAGPVDVFTTPYVPTLGTTVDRVFTITGTTITAKASINTSSIVVDSIWVADRTGTSAVSDIKLLAGRTVSAGDTGETMGVITLADNDTLAVTYSLALKATKA